MGSFCRSFRSVGSVVRSFGGALGRWVVGHPVVRSVGSVGRSFGGAVGRGWFVQFVIRFVVNSIGSVVSWVGRSTGLVVRLLGGAVGRSFGWSFVRWDGWSRRLVVGLLVVGCLVVVRLVVGRLVVGRLVGLVARPLGGAVGPLSVVRSSFDRSSFGGKRLSKGCLD